MPSKVVSIQIVVVQKYLDFEGVFFPTRTYTGPSPTTTRLRGAHEN